MGPGRKGREGKRADDQFTVRVKKEIEGRGGGRTHDERPRLTDYENAEKRELAG